MMTNKALLDIIVLGAGGTGTYFLKEFSRYLYNNYRSQRKIRSLAIFDGDRVEEKNLIRQAYIMEDIGMAKAPVIAGALNESFGLNWTGHAYYVLSKDQITQYIHSLKSPEKLTIPVIIGCVDNHACRIVCEDFFASSVDCIYFDAANEFFSGEVVFASKLRGVKKSLLRSDIFPEIKQGELRNVDEMSCTELNDVMPQHIAANMNAGLILLSALTTLLEDGIVVSGMTTFDVKQMESQHFQMNQPGVDQETVDTNRKKEKSI